MMNNHDLNCDWWTDQYDWECCCGATRIRHPDFVPNKLPVPKRDDDQRKSAAATAGTHEDLV